MRTTTTITLNREAEEAKKGIGEYLTNLGFVFTKYKRMMLWRKGNGWLTAPQIFNFRIEQDKLHIETWIPFALFPGVFIGESGLNSGFGFLVKVPMRQMVSELIRIYRKENTEVFGYIPR